MLSDEKLETALRIYFRSVATEVGPGDDLVEEVALRYRRRGVVVRAAAAVLVVLLAVGGTLLAAAGGGAPGPGSVSRLRLADYTFHLPGGYRRDAAPGLPACFPVAISQQPGAIPPASPTAGSSFVSPQIASAVTSAGGCVAMVLTEAYTPGPGGQDPYEAAATAIAVGPFRGWIQTGPGRNGNQVNLWVQLPLPNGSYHDLVVGTIGLSSTQVLSIVMSGLSS